MWSPALVLLGLLATAFTLASQLVVWRAEQPGQSRPEGGMLDQVMGESRRLFANHFLVKADVYLHSGVYPSIFDRPHREQRSHLSSAALSAESAGAHVHTAEEPERSSQSSDEDDADAVSDKPRDWLEAFGRNFYPVRHTHLARNQQKEILPWLRLAAELNPNQVETYTVAAYWLRSRMGKIQEAEEFLREGWRANPESHEILFELGRLYEENRHDFVRARNLLEAALHQWQRSEPRKAEPNDFALMQITGHLAGIEESTGRLQKALEYLDMLRRVSPRPETIQARIAQLQARLSKSKSESNATAATPL
ncbi:MAG TPA: hypothetical protein VLT57_02580 [Bryobacteraceae bacterium]|nr:hypothetical protein [Bryobacteraceae bacterium]